MRSFSERSSIGRKLSGRFVAGMSVDDVLACCDRVNRENIAATLDSLGESVTTEAEAQRSADIYHQLLDAIPARNLNANVSVKLSQVGMDFDPALAERIMGEMVEHAAQKKSFVRIDMEGSPYTEATIAMTERLHKKFPGSVGTVLQAYLYRTATDTERLLGQGIRIRLCKGAYKEGPEVAFPSKADVDANYVNLMKRMVTYTDPATGKGVFCGIATHDEAIVAPLRQQAQDRQASLRVPDALRRPPRPPAPTRRRWPRRACLHPLRPRVVPLLHAPPGRTPRQRPLPRQKLLQELVQSRSGTPLQTPAPLQCPALQCRGSAVSCPCAAVALALPLPLRCHCLRF
jgi:proline dehydrogenase